MREHLGVRVPPPSARNTRPAPPRHTVGGRGGPNSHGAVAQSGRALPFGSQRSPVRIRAPRFSTIQDGWPSGLRRTTGNRVGICPRGFESHPVRERQRTDGLGDERRRAGGGRAARRERRRRPRTAAAARRSIPPRPLSVSEPTGWETNGVEPEAVAPPGASAGDDRGRRQPPAGPSHPRPLSVPEIDPTASGARHAIPDLLRRPHRPRVPAERHAARGHRHTGPRQRRHPESSKTRRRRMDHACRGGSAPSRAVTIGRVEGDEPYLLHTVDDALRLADGRIVVLLYGTQELRVFGGDGTHLATWAGEGDGPGEFRSLVAIEHWRGDSIAAWYGPRRGPHRVRRERQLRAQHRARDEREVAPVDALRPEGDGARWHLILVSHNPHMFDTVEVQIRGPEGGMVASLGTHPGDERHISNEGTMYSPPFGARAVQRGMGRPVRACFDRPAGNPGLRGRRHLDPHRALGCGSPRSDAGPHRRLHRGQDLVDSPGNPARGD